MKRQPFDRKELHGLIYNYVSKYEDGFIESEIQDILSRYPEIDTDIFDNCLFGDTCAIIDGELVRYRTDISHAMVVALENKGRRYYEIGL